MITYPFEAFSASPSTVEYSFSKGKLHLFSNASITNQASVEIVSVLSRSEPFYLGKSFSQRRPVIPVALSTQPSIMFKRTFYTEQELGGSKEERIAKGRRQLQDIFDMKARYRAVYNEELPIEEPYGYFVENNGNFWTLFQYYSATDFPKDGAAIARYRDALRKANEIRDRLMAINISPVDSLSLIAGSTDNGYYPVIVDTEHFKIRPYND